MPSPPPQHVVPWLTQGPSAKGSALFLLPLLEAQMLTKRGSDFTVTAGPGRGKDTHSPVEATEELGAIRGEAEGVGCRQLVLGGGQGQKQAS